MKTFKQFITEGKYPTWTRLTVAGLALQIRSLSTQIENEKDILKQNSLIAKQNTLIGYITGLGVGISSSDKILMNRMRTMRKG